MSDTTEYLLTQFYGIGKTNKEIAEPIHYGLQSYQDKSSYNFISLAQNTISTNEESQQSLQTNLASNTEEIDSKISPSRSWRAIENDEEINDEGNGSKDEGLISDEQKIEELFDIDARASLPIKSTLPVVLEGRHDSPSARPSVTTVEDVYLDTLSDVSSRSTKKRGKKSLIAREPKITLPPIVRAQPTPSSSSLKAPVYNKLYYDMSNAMIQTLSVDIFDNFHDIRMLYLENNNLQELPDELFTKLKSLQWLDVRNNQLKTLPSTIKNHRCLETILLQGNQIERLPLELCLIPSLKSIHLAHNPLVFPSVDVRALGFKAMMDCLREEWNKVHPDEVITPQKEVQSVTTILCQEPSKKFKRLKLSEYSRKSSKTMDNISVRERSKNYKPSNRCPDYGDNKMHEEKFLKMCRLRENLIRQNKILQKIKDKNVLKNWQQDRRSFEKSMKKAAERTQISYGIFDSDNQSNNYSKHMFTSDINNKMSNVIESLQNFHIQTSKGVSDPIIERNKLENGIKKLKSIKKEIENLKNQNEKSLVLYKGNQSIEYKEYKSPPSIII
ncbi:E3 ubiquitin-protein ligase LRSAM1-like [Chelonus insularis]|uniref:E3 ubiquitin-protein ligase LRSAM1-like n=1 Tax=Chelonus insularis TaxID=460826 RepID=UPI00158B6665|nr:E3 ubiquitin-protein ligase LRSAM1-like [Chelonus insularis]